MMDPDTYTKTPQPGKLRLNEEALRWLRLKWGRIRKSQQMADKANNEWNEANAEFREWLDRMGIEDPVQRAKRKSENLRLKEALDVGKWHAAEAQRHIDDVNLFLKLKELEVL